MWGVLRQLRVELSDEEWAHLKSLVALHGQTLQQFVTDILKDEIRPSLEKARNDAPI